MCASSSAGTEHRDCRARKGFQAIAVERHHAVSAMEKNAERSEQHAEGSELR